MLKSAGWNFFEIIVSWNECLLIPLDVKVECVELIYQPELLVLLVLRDSCNIRQKQ